ncbi:hypothetical protein HC928_14965, partial [bacterium]|nr:hypothetical protein [bacterium]
GEANDTRRQQPITALQSADDDHEQFAATLNHLAEQRLLVLGGTATEDRTVDLPHEALIGSWPTLRDWIAQRREAEQTRRRLEARATDWVNRGQGKGGLLDEIELREAQRWRESSDIADLGISDALLQLIDSSHAVWVAAAEAESRARREREMLLQERAEAERQRAEVQVLARQRLRQRAILLAMALVAALVAMVLAGISGARANKVLRLHEALLRRLRRRKPLGAVRRMKHWHSHWQQYRPTILLPRSRRSSPRLRILPAPVGSLKAIPVRLPVWSSVQMGRPFFLVPKMVPFVSGICPVDE